MINNGLRALAADPTPCVEVSVAHHHRQDPYLPLNQAQPWRERGLWPCFWIACPGAEQPPFVTAYRLRFTLDRNVTVRTHVGADERYELFLDGQRIGRGSEQGAPDC